MLVRACSVDRNVLPEEAPDLVVALRDFFSEPRDEV